MKRTYAKPTIHVEVMSLDMPVATSCESNLEVMEMMAQGWFFTDCFFRKNEAEEEMGAYGDTFCVHSHAKTTFAS